MKGSDKKDVRFSAIGVSKKTYLRYSYRQTIMIHKVRSIPK
jgi:hypothetical protein